MVEKLFKAFAEVKVAVAQNTKSHKKVTNKKPPIISKEVKVTKKCTEHVKSKSTYVPCQCVCVI